MTLELFFLCCEILACVGLLVSVVVAMTSPSHTKRHQVADLGVYVCKILVLVFYGLVLIF